MVRAHQNGVLKTFWCSSSTWIFSELPSCPTDPEDCKKLASVNNLFTGEFDAVLFPGSGAPKVIDAELGVVLQPKALTELDRLSYVFSEMSKIFVHPKNYMKFVPAGKCIENEAFRGLSKE